MSVPPEQNLVFGDHQLDPARRTLHCGDSNIPLNAKAFDLLYFFVRNPGRPVSKDELLESVWAGQFVEESNLAVQISALRKALGDSAGEPSYLATIPGKGYQFVAEVRTDSADAVETAPEDTKAAAPSAHRSRASVYAAAGLLIVAALLAIGHFGTAWSDSAGDVRSIAVLPFVNQTGDSGSDILADGLAESVIFSLSRIPELKVLSRDSSFRYRESGEDARAIGRVLGVNAILTGRLLRRDDLIVVRTEVISAADNSVLWGEQFTRPLMDLETLQTDIARAITRQLQIKLQATDEVHLSSGQTTDHEAFQLYLAGRYHLNKLTDDGFKKALELFQSASVRDPEYALAYSAIAESYNLLGGWGAAAPNDSFPLAKAGAVKALEIDPGLADAHTQLAIVRLFYDMDWPGAETAFTKAIELNPNSSDAHHMLAYTLMLRGAHPEARRSVEIARQLDPLSVLKTISAGNIELFDRNYAGAEHIYQQALQMEPGSATVMWSLGNTFFAKGDFEKAVEYYQTAVAGSGDSPDEPATLAAALARQGRTAEARVILEQLKTRAETAYVPKSLFAQIHAALGETDEAFAYLEAAVRDRDSLIPFLKVDPLFDPLREDPRYDVLLTRVGIP